MSINKNELFNIKTMNELFKSKKIWLQNVITPKKRVFKKVGVWGIIFLFGTAAFISGTNINSYAASSNTVLSVARGGTGANTFASNQALIGNGNSAFQTKPIDSVPQTNSNNLITSGALANIATAVTIPQNWKTYNSGTLTTSTNPVVLGDYPEITSSNKQANIIFDVIITQYTNSPSTAASVYDGKLDISTSSIHNPNSTINPAKITTFAKFPRVNSSFGFEIGYFTYNNSKYVGLKALGTNGGWMYLNGIHKGTICEIPADTSQICLGSSVLENLITDWTTLASTND
ncbi:MAG: hypothetical protein LBT91_00070 [Bifidobacteriaceae bacterium]|jgi:hypothetical protein|nr:hypothetical protein [Bifidobacteriaceae bacterium]